MTSKDGENSALVMILSCSGVFFVVILELDRSNTYYKTTMFFKKYIYLLICSKEEEKKNKKIIFYLIIYVFISFN